MRIKFYDFVFNSKKQTTDHNKAISLIYFEQELHRAEKQYKQRVKYTIIQNNMLRDFVAIDFETANKELSSVCSVGIVVVRNSTITDRFYSLIQPEPNYYSYRNSCIHELTAEDTDNAKIFAEVWKEVAPLIQDLPLVAHNKGFDESSLKAVFRTYRIDYPNYVFYCTLTASRRQLKHLPNHQLHTVAQYCGYTLTDHHHALADAEACAQIAMQLL